MKKINRELAEQNRRGESFFFFKLKDSWFTVLCWFLLYSKPIWLYM